MTPGLSLFQSGAFGSATCGVWQKTHIRSVPSATTVFPIFLPLRERLWRVSRTERPRPGGGTPAPAGASPRAASTG